MFLLGYIAGVSTVVVPLGLLYAKGFFKGYVNPPVVTVSKDGVEVKPDGQAKQ